MLGGFTEIGRGGSWCVDAAPICKGVVALLGVLAIVGMEVE